MENERVKNWDFDLIEELDFLLNWFAEKKGLERQFGQIYAELSSKKYSSYQYTKDISGIISTCLFRLVKDNYVTEQDRDLFGLDHSSKNEKIKTYCVSFDGLLFLQTYGSYKNYFRIENSEKNRLKDLENHHKKNESAMTSLTLVLAGFAALMAILEIIKMSIDKNQEYAATAISVITGIFIFVLGLISGIIIYLLFSSVGQKEVTH